MTNRPSRMTIAVLPLPAVAAYAILALVSCAPGDVFPEGIALRDSLAPSGDEYRAVCRTAAIALGWGHAVTGERHSGWWAEVTRYTA